jgi:chromosome segregation ATPase
MKSKVILILLILIPVIGIKSQIPVIVSEDSLKIGKNLLPGFSVTIPESNYDKTLDAWKRELQASTKSKVVTENNEMSIFGAILKNLSPNPMNVYSRLIRLDSMLQLFVSLEKKKDEYIERTTSVAEYIKVKDYLKQFAKNQYIDVAKAQSDAEDKKLYNLQKELSSLENEKSRMQISIQSDKDIITVDNNNITFQNDELRTVEAALKEQNNLLSTMEEGAARKEKSEQIKELEKRKKRALNSIESSENRVAKARNAIDKANNELPINEQKQARLIEQVNQQEAVSLKYAEKLKRIREY